MCRKEQLYVLDVYLNKITLAPCVLEVPRKEEIDIFVTFSNFVDMNIKSNNSTAVPLNENISVSRDELNLNVGKSQVFFSNADNLCAALSQSPLNILLKTHWNGESFGEVNLTWTSDFVSMVKKSKHFCNKVIPARIEAVQDIINMAGKVIGQVDMFIRLSGFGEMTYEQFQEMPRPPMAIQPPPLQMKTFFQFSNASPVVTFLIGLMSFTIFISALYLAVT